MAVEAGRARLVEDRLPRRVSDSMRARLLRMSPAANRLATLASALGRRFSVHELAQMAGMPITELLDPVQELAQADIFTESGGRLAFGHDLIREAVRSSSPVPVRREALTSAEASIARLAAEGKTNREIAETLFISPHRVNSHLRHIFDKLGVNSRIHLTKTAGAPPARHAD